VQKIRRYSIIHEHRLNVSIETQNLSHLKSRYHLHTRNLPAAAVALLKLIAAWTAAIGHVWAAWWEATVAVPLRRVFPFMDAQHRLAQLKLVRLELTRVRGRSVALVCMHAEQVACFVLSRLKVNYCSARFGRNQPHTQASATVPGWCLAIDWAMMPQPHRLVLSHFV